MNLEHFRREYLIGGLKHADLDSSPFIQFDLWMNQALEAGIIDPTAMVLATVGESGLPSQRIVLLKDVDETGFVFFTNYGSRKALDMLHNNRVSLLFPWSPLERQVQVRGAAEKVSAEQSLRYFSSRPRESQQAAWASDQSTVIPSRAHLLQQLSEVKTRFEGQEVPLPDFWGGYRVIPDEIEFWQGGANRLHDRFRYNLKHDRTWDICRLAP